MTTLSNPLTEPIGAERPDYSARDKKKPMPNATARFKADPSMLAAVLSDLGYDDDAGRVFWIKNPKRGPRKAGTYAGLNHKSGFRQIKFRGALLMESHVVWALTQGEWPLGTIKHVDGDRGNTHADNLILESSKSKENGLPTGITRHDNGQFKAFIYRKKRHYLGIFDTVEEAKAQYEAAKKLVHNHKNWAVDPETLLQGLMIDYKNRAKSVQT